MKTFLSTLQKQNNHFSILQQSKNIHLVEQEELLILFTGKNISTLDELQIAYQTEGINFLKKIKGSFACVIYDKVKNQLFIAKDKVGIEPLYFAYTHSSIIIGTHLNQFKEVENFETIINPNSVANYMQFGFILQPNTIFKECYKVCSGEYICFDLNKKTYKSTKYWELESYYLNPKSLISEKETLENVHALLQESIEESQKNSHYGLSLSGGYDSSTLTAICQKQSEHKIDTFTIGFHENKINEAPHAKAIAKHLGTNHHEHYFTAKDALELIPKMCKVYDEPFADHATSPTMLTSQLLKENHVDNLIAGDGGDEVFATAEDVHFFGHLQNSPQLLKYLIAQPLNLIPIDKIPYLKEHNNLPKKYNKLMKLLLAKNIPQMIQIRNTLFLEKELHAQIKNYEQPLITSFEQINFQGSAECVDEIIGTYFKTTMVDGELVKSYAAMNHMDISLSTPFLNTKLVEYMATVPSSIKIKNDIKKYLLKEIAHQYIPKELLARPKCGFDIPFSSWMKNKLKDILYSQINKERLDKDNIFYTTSILNIRNQFYAGNDAYKYKLWRVFIFQLWYENFMLSIKK